MKKTDSSFEMNLRRRDFLKTAGAATLGALASGAPRAALGSANPISPRATADSVIVLWMAGGMAHTETFDPKRYTPFRKGLPANELLCSFPSIETAVDGVQLTKGLEKTAAVLDRGTLLRTHVLGDLGFILHSRHQYHWHTGYEPPLTVAAPHIGAWIAQALGPRDEAMPAFIDIGQRYEGNGEAEEIKAFQTAGFLGSEFGPFRVPDPKQAVNVVRPPAGMTVDRFKRRYETYRKVLESSPVARDGSAYQKESLLRSAESAYRLMNSPASKAFDLGLEPEESYKTYNTSKFGLGCLLARRLVEKGARFIEVTTEYGPFKQWDTHENGHTRLTDMKRQIDAPIAQLVLDLEERGLLDRTLIVLASEFSRDCMVEGKPEKQVRNQVNVPNVINEMKFYGMHRHFTSASSVLLFGGGIKKGAVYGKTAEERPCTTIENPVTITDLHSTIFHAMGISPKHNAIIEDRPFYATKDGKGKPVLDLFG